MKTTLDLPDDLMRTVKIRAAHENRKLKDVIADLLQRGLAQEQAGRGAVRERVQLPLVQTARRPRPDDEMTPDRIAEVLLHDDAEAAIRE